MDIVKTGIGIGKTFKSANRLKEIVKVFAKNGFGSVLKKMGLGSDHYSNDVIDDINNLSWSRELGTRLRISFEELGTTFIKLGQVLSTREDIFNSELTAEMKKLLDSAKGIPFSELKDIVEQSLDQPIEKIFKKIETNPEGVASIAIVYKALTVNDEVVVVKIKRPGIDEQIKTDMVLLKFLLNQIEKISDDIKALGLKRVLEDFETSIYQELDFYIEALNCQKLESNIRKIDKKNLFHFPKIYKEYSTNNILVMEYLDGIKFSQIDLLKDKIDEIKDMLLYSVDLFQTSLLQDGLFHADLHGGNFFYLKNGKIGLIDFGLMGHLSKNTRVNLVMILSSLLQNEYENLVFELLEVADYKEIPNIDELTRDLKNALIPYIGLSIKETNIAGLFTAVSKTLVSHKIFLPREWIVIFRALVTLDGVGRSLKIDFNIYEVLDKKVKEVKKVYLNKDEILKESIWLGRSGLGLLKLLPRHLKWILKEYAKRNYRLDVNIIGLESNLSLLSESIKKLSFSLFGIISLILSVYFLYHPIPLSSLYEIPLATWVFFVFFIILFVKMLV